MFDLHCAEWFETRKLCFNSSAEGGIVFRAHLKSEFKVRTHEQDFVTSQLVWEPVMVQDATYSLSLQCTYTETLA